MKILLAVSGGIDSMCMADMFDHAHNGFTLGIAHCNFHLRGEESDGDAVMVQEWAEQRGIPFHKADFQTSEYASEKGISIEMAARELRYSWFSKIAQEEGYDAVAVAHNANDNVETFLLNLLRGCGGRGLRGMNPDGRIPGTDTPLLRPMLSFSREEIEEYAREYEVPFREDSTNAETVYRRNRLRHEVLPVFESINPAYLRTIAMDMEHIAQENDIANDYFDDALKCICDGDSLSVDALLRFKHWEYILFRFTEPAGLNARTLAALSEHISEYAEGRKDSFSGRRFEGTEGDVLTSSGCISLNFGQHGEYADVTVNGPGEYSINGTAIRISVRSLEPETPLKQPTGTLVMNAAALGFPFTLRGWRHGDWMRPFGMKGRKKKLSDMFTDMKFTAEDKRKAVLLVKEGQNDGHVMALLGHRMDEALRVTKGSEHIIEISVG